MSDTDRVSGTGRRVNGESRFSRIREDVESACVRDPISIVFKLLGHHIDGKSWSGGTFSIWGMPCPKCGKVGTKDKTPTYLSSDRKEFHCASCKYHESLVFLFLSSNGLSLKNDVDLCCDKLSLAAGVSSHDEDFNSIVDNTGKWIIDIDDSKYDLEVSKPRRPTHSPTRTMPDDKKDWILTESSSFINRADAGDLLPQERGALQYVMKRGISRDAIIKSGLFVHVNSKVIMVVMPSYDCDGNPVGYQWFDYEPVSKGLKPEYRACKSEYGSCKHPFGVDTCIENSNPIFMVCGFFDYLSALTVGFDSVLSPFGVTMLSSGASHIKDVISGRSVTILFDRKIQEFDQSLIVADSLRNIGAKVNVLLWMKGKDGFDFNDFIIGCKNKGIENPKSYLSDLIKNGSVKKISHGIQCDIDSIVRDSCMDIGSYIMSGSWPVPIISNVNNENINGESNKSIKNNGCGTSLIDFEPDLEKSIANLDSSGNFHTLIMFTDISSRFEMCDTLEVKRCKLMDHCSCATRCRLDISDGRYSSAFVNNAKISPAIESINETYTFNCPNYVGWDASKAGPKKILYRSGEISKTWSVIEARSLFSSGSKVKMVTKIPAVKTGIYEVKGFKSAHCGTTGSVFVISEMKPYSIDLILKSMEHEKHSPCKIDFFDGVSSIIDSGFVGTPDIILVSSVCAWAFSPPVVPLIKDIGCNIDNYRQPSLSIYAIGDPATGKTNTIREISEFAGYRCDPTDAKMATKPGLIISGSDGSPGQLPRSVCKAMGLDEITDKKSTLEVVQLLVENRLSISMSGRHIDEVIPVRVALLSNADAERKKIHEFRTPMEAASGLIKEHLIRRIDLCVATTQISSNEDIYERNNVLYRENHGLKIDKKSLYNLGKRCWRQNPKDIIVDSVAMEFLLNEKNIMSKIDHVKIGNPMLYGDMSQRVLRIASGIAGFSGSFDGDKMIINMDHVNYAIDLMNATMSTMGASKEARFHMRTMDVEKAHSVLIDVCAEALSMMESTHDTMMMAGKVIISFIQTCNAHDPGSIIDTGIKELFRDMKESKTDVASSDRKLAPYKRAWKLIDKMKRHGLIKSESRGSYSVTETFARSIVILETENPVIHRRILD